MVQVWVRRQHLILRGRGWLQNGPLRKAGKLGQALEFNGLNNRVIAGSSSDFDNLPALTLSGWFYRRGYDPAGDHMLAKANNGSSFIGWRLASNDANARLLFEVGYDTQDLIRSSSSDTLKLNRWQHLVVTWDGSDFATGVHIYVDGIETSYAAPQNPIGSQDDDDVRNLIIGANDGGFDYYPGLIDDVRIYNRVLSPDEVKRLYLMGR